MADAQAPKVAPLTIMAAQEGGFVVFEDQYSGGAQKILHAGGLEDCLEYMARAFSPAYEMRPLIDIEADSVDLKDLLKSVGPIVYVPPTDLDDALHDLRLRDVKCGLQVLAADHIVAWLGDIQKAVNAPTFRAWGHDLQFPAIFHECRGPDALEQAAKWLREEGAKG